VNRIFRCQREASREIALANAAPAPSRTAGREVILFNGRGVASASGKPRTRIEDMADDAAAVIRAIGLNRATRRQSGVRTGRDGKSATPNSDRRRFSALLFWPFRSRQESRTCVLGKRLSFQIHTSTGAVRYYIIENGAVRSWVGLSDDAQFTLSFVDAAKVSRS